jgi:hypothetical protein
MKRANVIVIMILMLQFGACSPGSVHPNKDNTTDSIIINNDSITNAPITQSYLDEILDTGSLEDLGTKTAGLEKEIDSLYGEQLRILTDKKRQDLAYGLIKTLKADWKTYKDVFANRSEMIFMSYGLGAKDERKNAFNGYYYLQLKERKQFLLGIGENISYW